jgi:WD40 repeat protein
LSQGASEPFGDLQSFDFEGAGVIRFEPPKGEKVFWSVRLAISPDGRLLVAGCGGGIGANIAAGVWNLKTGRFLRLLTGPRILGASETVFSRDGAFLVTSHFKDIRVWSTKTWKCVCVMKGGANMAITTDGRFLAYEDRKQKHVRIRPFTLP